jgi:hypothetical protein
MDVSGRILRTWMPAIHAGTTELLMPKIPLHTGSSIGTEFVMNTPGESTSETSPKGRSLSSRYYTVAEPIIVQVMGSLLQGFLADR